MQKIAYLAKQNDLASIRSIVTKCSCKHHIFYCKRSFDSL